MIQIQLPPTAEARLREAWGDQLDRAAFESLVIESYRSARVSAGEVAELLDLETSIAAQSWLAGRGVPVNYEDTALEEDRRTLARHFPDFKP